jgi:hypothetical protein
MTPIKLLLREPKAVIGKWMILSTNETLAQMAVAV